MDTWLSRLGVVPGIDTSIVGQLRSKIALLIADGAIRSGDRLPPVRAVARDLGISVNTVRAAYAKLEADGLVVTRHGVGTTVRPGPLQWLQRQPHALGTNAVAVLIGGLDPFYLPMVRGVEEVAAESGTLVVVVDGMDSPGLAHAMIGRLLARGVNGIVAASVGAVEDQRPGEPDIGHGRTPIVYVDQPDAVGNVLLFDAERGGGLATEHLIEHGHRRVGIITPPLSWPNVREVHKGYVGAVQQAGADQAPNLVVEVPAFAIEAGRVGLAKLLDLPDPPTAVLANGAVLALGALHETRSRGLRVPQDLAIAGYTDIEVAALVEPPLTMVSLPARDIGRQAMRILQRLIDGQDVASERTVLGVELVVRTSCGPH